MRTTEHDGAMLRVASYNVRKCIGLDRRRLPGRTLEVIGKLNADLVAIQEADRRLGKRPAAIPADELFSKTGLRPLELGGNSVSLGWHGNAILVRDGLNAESSQGLDLPGLEPRGAVVAELSFGERRIRVVALHLGLMRTHRVQQLQEILSQLETRRAMPTIILGDFNERSPEKGLQALATGFDVHTPGFSYHSARPVAALDRIAVSRDIRLHDAGVHACSLARMASDHLPVWADLLLPDGADSAEA